MKKLIALALILSAFTLTSCFEDGDDIPIQTADINDFVWKGMNLFYLYKANMSQLSNSEFGLNAIDDRYGRNEVYNNYLGSFGAPGDLFESLIYQRSTVDRFSWIVDDYIELERNFSGISVTNGMEFDWFIAPNTANGIIGVVRLVLPNTSADMNGVKRGDIFYAINGTPLNDSNFRTLENQNSYTINLATYNDQGTPDNSDDTIDPINESIDLSKSEYTENPIFISKTLDVSGKKVGYLMYNGFVRNSEIGLNSAFADFKSNTIDELVVDLRYNRGGSVSTTTFLASMITGQFTGEVFGKIIYNAELQNNNTDYLFADKLDDKPKTPINSLNLNKIYVLTSETSASASESLINSLKPYINVIQVGTNTRGKTQASITIYDSPNFSRDGVNPRHTYAMQPLVANGVNRNDVSVPSDGLPPTPNFEYKERQSNYGVLGDVNEPLLALALADIDNTTSKFFRIKSKLSAPLHLVSEGGDINPLEGGLIID